MSKKQQSRNTRCALHVYGPSPSPSLPRHIRPPKRATGGRQWHLWSTSRLAEGDLLPCHLIGWRTVPPWQCVSRTGCSPHHCLLLTSGIGLSLSLNIRGCGIPLGACVDDDDEDVLSLELPDLSSVGFSWAGGKAGAGVRCFMRFPRRGAFGTRSQGKRNSLLRLISVIRCPERCDTPALRAYLVTQKIQNI